MKFYFRDEELKELEILRKQSTQGSKMAVLTGRRRVGKTSLAIEFTKNKRFVYLFVARKSELMLCQGFIEEIKKKLDIVIHGKIETFKEIFSVLMEHAQNQHFTLIIDEFQEFYNINSSVYSDVQNIWDLEKNNTKMNLIFIGSIYSMMHKIFEGANEPLFGRADRVFKLKPFTISQLKIILADYNVRDVESLFEFYVITGGTPKYLDILLSNQCTTFNKVLDFMLKENSPFLDEGKNQIIEDFGSQHAIYFSILELIARGKTSASEIEPLIQKNVSSYLDKLEKDYNLISKFKPINAKPNSKLQKYHIVDNFLKFWFRFIYKNREAIELRNFQYIKTVIQQGFDTYSGKILEKFFYELLAATGKYNRQGSYWERGFANEIDIVAVNDLEKIIVLVEVKKNKNKINLALLAHRAENLLSQYKGYTVQYLGLGLENAAEYL